MEEGRDEAKRGGKREELRVNRMVLNKGQCEEGERYIYRIIIGKEKRIVKGISEMRGEK